MFSLIHSLAYIVRFDIAQWNIELLRRTTIKSDNCHAQWGIGHTAERWSRGGKTRRSKQVVPLSTFFGQSKTKAKATYPNKKRVWKSFNDIMLVVREYACMKPIYLVEYFSHWLWLTYCRHTNTKHEKKEQIADRKWETLFRTVYMHNH